MGHHRFLPLLATTLLSTSTHGTAAVAPYFQSSNEITAILSDPSVIAATGGVDAVDAVLRKGSEYELKTSRCVVVAVIEYAEASLKTPPVPGQLSFTVKIKSSHCAKGR